MRKPDFFPVPLSLLILQYKMVQRPLESIDMANAVILVFVFVSKDHLSSQNLLGCFFVCYYLFVFFDPTCPFQVQPLCGQGWWVPQNFDLYRKPFQCFPLIRNVFIFVHPCRPFEPNHSVLTNSLQLGIERILVAFSAISPGFELAGHNSPSGS